MPPPGSRIKWRLRETHRRTTRMACNCVTHMTHMKGRNTERPETESWYGNRKRHQSWRCPCWADYPSPVRADTQTRRQLRQRNSNDYNHCTIDSANSRLWYTHSQTHTGTRHTDDIDHSIDYRLPLDGIILMLFAAISSSSTASL